MTAHAQPSNAPSTRPQRVSHTQLGVVGYPLAAIAITLTICCALPLATIAGCVIAEQKVVSTSSQIYASLQAIPLQVWCAACTILGWIVDDGIPAFPAWVRMMSKKFADFIAIVATAFADAVDMLHEDRPPVRLSTSPNEKRYDQVHPRSSSDAGSVAGPIVVSNADYHSHHDSKNHNTSTTSSPSSNTGDPLSDSCLSWKSTCDIAIDQGRRSMTHIPPAPIGVCPMCLSSPLSNADNLAFKSCHHSMGGVYIVLAIIDAQKKRDDEHGSDTRCTQKARETACYRALLKQERLRWHPDKFCALPYEAKGLVQAQAKEMFQMAQKLQEKELKQEKTLTEELMLCLEAMWSWLKGNWRTVVLVIVVFVTVEVLQRLRYI